MAHISARPTSIAGSHGGAGGGADAATTTAATGAAEDGLQGYSSSSSSSIYQHPFASFNFGTTLSSKNDDVHESAAPLSARLDAMAISPKHTFSTRIDPSAPASPSTSYAESQHSHSMDEGDYEYDMDSPSSISSWNSFHSGYRGDLADVEDLELGEPELETVSELDEDNYQGQSQSQSQPHHSPTLESDDDHAARPEGNRFSDNLARRRTITPHHHGHHVAHTGQGGFHGLPHFSPRNGGNGLSHHSRWTSRAPASLVARRRKGRIAELAEEGAGEAPGINTTKMPAKDQQQQPTAASSDRSSSASAPASASASGASSPLSLTSASPPGRCDANGNYGNCGSYPGTPPAAHWAEFAGPPPLPVRSISPSETVPAVPSPLCECINANADAVAPSPSTPVGEQPPDADASLPDDVTPTASRMTDAGHRVADHALPAPTPRRGVFEAETADALTCKESHSPPTTPEKGSAVTGRGATTSSPDTTPPTSPVQPLLRRNSRPRRSSSPVQHLSSKARMPLRPCFSRRNSAQTSGQSTRDSSLERERGRVHVRFSPAPPQTIRTHSPVDYDRSSCPINNRLSVEDVEEMQKMDMEMGLLSAKCSAIAALTSCKLPSKAGSGSGAETSATDDQSGDSASSSSSSPPRDDAHPQHLAPPGPEAFADRPRRESTGGLTGHYDPRAGSSRPAAMSSKSSASLSPAEHLRLQRERERERACRMAGIGTGLGGRNLGNGVRGQATNPLIARFGLTTPPPPLPSSTSRRIPSTSAPPSLADAGRSPQPEAAADTDTDTNTSQAQPQPQSDSYDRDGTPSLDDAYEYDRDSTLSPPRTRPTRASSLQRTSSEERAARRSLAPAESDREGEGEEGPERGRTAQQPPPSPSSPSPSMPGKALPSLALTSPSPPPQPKPQLQAPRGSYFPTSAAPAPRARPAPRPCGGYDSPGSAYESGSEYDLIG